eukprot:12749239-Prorocentrum_lima.AAC.1
MTSGRARASVSPAKHRLPQNSTCMDRTHCGSPSAHTPSATCAPPQSYLPEHGAPLPSTGHPHTHTLSLIHI